MKQYEILEYLVILIYSLNIWMFPLGDGSIDICEKRAATATKVAFLFFTISERFHRFSVSQSANDAWLSIESRTSAGSRLELQLWPDLEQHDGRRSRCRWRRRLAWLAFAERKIFVQQIGFDSWRIDRKRKPLLFLLFQQHVRPDAGWRLSPESRIHLHAGRYWHVPRFDLGSVNQNVLLPFHAQEKQIPSLSSDLTKKNNKNQHCEKMQFVFTLWIPERAHRCLMVYFEVYAWSYITKQRLKIKTNETKSFLPLVKVAQLHSVLTI